MNFKIKKIDNGYVIKYWSFGEDYDPEEYFVSSLDEKSIQSFFIKMLNIPSFDDFKEDDNSYETGIYSFNNDIKILGN